MVQLHKVHHAFQNRGPERIRFALPCCHDQPHRFTVERFAHLLVEPESRTNAADAVIGQLLAGIIETQPHPVGGCENRRGNGIAAHHLGTEPDACRQRRREAVLLGKEQGFLFHGHARVHLAEDRQILAAVAEDAPLDGVLPIHYDELTVTETDLRLVCHIFVEVGGDQFHTLALHTTLIQFAGVDQLAAVDDHELVRRVDMDKGIGVVFQAHRISSLILQMYVSASFRISATCRFRFGMVSRLGLNVKLYSSRWIIACTAASSSVYSIMSSTLPASSKDDLMGV